MPSIYSAAFCSGVDYPAFEHSRYIRPLETAAEVFLVARLTFADATPGTARILRSTRATQLAQVLPST